MKKSELIALGLTEEQADKALVIHGLDIEGFKQKNSAYETENAGLKGQLTEASSVIEGFKKIDPAKIQAEADDWKTKAEKAAEEVEATRQAAEDQIAEMEFNQTLVSSLTEAGAKNPVAVAALLDFDKLNFDEQGNITGLEDQLKTLQETDDYLFSSGGENPKIMTGSHTPDTVLSDAAVVAARKAAGLKD
jgi:hypothetical protein